MEHHSSIQTFINRYENQQRRNCSNGIYILEGKVVTFEEACRSPGWVFSEVCLLFNVWHGKTGIEQ
jgi:hypothetical protein